MRAAARFFAGLVFAVCSACAVAPVSKTTTTYADVTAVESWREFELAIHADTSFTDVGRACIQEAAGKWRAASAGRIRIDVVFDLDFDSLENLKAHQSAKHALLIGVFSSFPIAERIDELLGSAGRTPMAATMTGEGQPPLVFFIVDRISTDDFVSVAAHEFGHVAGLPDLPAFGSVMSGARFRDAPSVNDFTPDDIALCRASRLCP